MALKRYVCTDVFASQEVLFILDECNRATGALENKETELNETDPFASFVCCLFQSKMPIIRYSFRSQTRRPPHSLTS
jgi:hypothetical protein